MDFPERRRDARYRGRERIGRGAVACGAPRRSLTGEEGNIGLEVGKSECAFTSKGSQSEEPDRFTCTVSCYWSSLHLRVQHLMQTNVPVMSLQTIRLRI